MCRPCSVKGCSRVHYGRSYCRNHYQLFMKYGDPTHVKRPPVTFAGITLSKRQWAKKLGIDGSSLSWRLHNGWSIERALKTKRGLFGPKAKVGVNERA